MKQTTISMALAAVLGFTVAGCSMQTIKQASIVEPRLADAEAQYALGRFYQGQQRYELAIDAYRKALAISPTHVSAHNGLGASLLLIGHSQQAIEQFKEGLKHQPRSAALWNNLGYAYTLIGEPSLAQVALRQALDLDPMDARTQTNLAKAQTVEPVAVASSKSEPAHPAVESAGQKTEQAVLPAAPSVAAADPTPVAPEQIPVASKKNEHPAQVAVAQMETTMPVAAPVKVEPAVQVVEVAPRVYELNIAEQKPVSASAVTIALQQPSEAKHISVPLYDEAVVSPVFDAKAEPVMSAATEFSAPDAPPAPVHIAATQAAALNNEDFHIEIRNGNGVRHMALRTSQYLAGHGYTTKRLTNQKGFNVATTRILYLPGYLAEAQRLMAHLPMDTTLTEVASLKRGVHVRVVLGKDMAEQKSAWNEASQKLQVAALSF